MRLPLMICLIFIQPFIVDTVWADVHEFNDEALTMAKVKECSVKETPESYLIKKYPVDKDSEVDFMGIKLKKVRPGLVNLLSEMFTIDMFTHKTNVTIDIAKIKDIKTCQDEICIASSVFGRGNGAYYLYFLDKYNLNLSPYSYRGSVDDDQTYFSTQELKAIEKALSILPRSVFSNYSFNKHFKRIRQDRGNVIANSGVNFFEIFQSLPLHEKIETVIHEIGHNMASELSYEGVDESDFWLKLSDWKVLNKDFQNATPGEKRKNFISWYARANPWEDFAENFTAYILNPTLLQKVSNEKYNFMKEKIFAGVEYTGSDCHTKINVDYEDKLNSLKIDGLARACVGSLYNSVVDVDLKKYTDCLLREVGVSKIRGLAVDTVADRQKISKSQVFQTLKKRSLDILINEHFTKPEYCRDHLEIIAFQSNYDLPDKVVFSREETENYCRWISNDPNPLKTDNDKKESLKSIFLKRLQ